MELNRSSYNTTAQKITLKQVLPTDPKVIALIEKLNAYQISLYGIEKCNLETPESLMANNAFMVGAFDNDTLAGIGAIKLRDTYAEIKRMYVDEKFRGLSIAASILSTLESTAIKSGISLIFLETGNKQHAAIKFYKRAGYAEVDRFSNYLPNDTSIYFQKVLTSVS